MNRRIAFWITRDDLLSNHPSAIQVVDETKKIAKPATGMRRDHCHGEYGRTGRKGSQYGHFMRVVSKTKGCPRRHGQPLLCNFLT